MQKQQEFELNKQRVERNAEMMLRDLEQRANFEALMKVQAVELQHEAQ